jgi:hypothetical protein
MRAILVAVFDDHSVVERVRVSLVRGPAGLCLSLVRCTHCLRPLTAPVAIDRNSSKWDGRCDACSRPFELAQVNQARGGPVSMLTELRLARAASLVVEESFAECRRTRA